MNKFNFFIKVIVLFVSVIVYSTLLLSSQNQKRIDSLEHLINETNSDSLNNIIYKQIFEIYSLPNNIESKIQFEKSIKELVTTNKIFQLLLLFIFLLFVLLIIFLFLNRKKNKNIQSAILSAEHERYKAEEAKQKLDESTEKIRSQTALSDILRNVSGKERSIEEFLKDALEKLLALPWLSVLAKGSIFLTDNNGNLKMVAEKNLGRLKERCALIKPGECLCGKALSEKKIQYSNHLTHDHAITFDDMEEHGHYNLPVMMNEEVLGVMNLYTEHNHKKSDFELEFLKSVSDTLAAVINRKKALVEIKAANRLLSEKKFELEKHNLEVNNYLSQIEKQKKEQESMNQKLFAQKLEVEQRNTEAEHYVKQIENQAKEQEALNQKLFAQKLEVEQRNIEALQYADQIEKKNKEQEILNQKLFAQKLEVEQRNFEVQQYADEIEKKKIDQDALNQKLFAQSLEVDQRRIEIEQYSQEVEKLKEKAESAYEHINNSINYAKTIQDTLLPAKTEFIKHFSDDYFIYYEPKENIGGDFYFLNKVNDTILFAVADCTGHGVPGALITMLGITFLQDLTERNIINSTGEALKILRKRIKDTFKSYGKDIQNKNGMDIAICAVDTKTNIMQFSGAFSPMIVIRDNEIIEFKGTRNPIGYYPVEKEFQTQKFQLLQNDHIYLFSDGYIDQIGGENNKKFLRRQFYELIKKVHSYPMQKQKMYFERIMQKWIGNNSKVDDMTILGIKWKLF